MTAEVDDAAGRKPLQCLAYGVAPNAKPDGQIGFD
jgi:hypothetical protein